MARPRTVLVVNPAAQGGRLGKRWPELAGEIRRELGGFEEALTAAPGDAGRLTREALESGAGTVVAVGGDGTINEVANGFFDGDRARAPEAALGVVPFGTGGDFRRSIRVPRATREAARILADHHTRTIDVGHLTFTDLDGQTGTRIFVNISSFGWSGLVVEIANTSSKRLGAKASFLLAAARGLLRYENQRVRMVFDGDEKASVELGVAMVAVANGRFFGGGMQIAPTAELDDGTFDVVAVADVSKLTLVRSFPRVYSGSHLDNEGVSLRRAKQVRAEPLGTIPIRLDVDGENPGKLPATFRILPGALRVVCPKA
ncbi:MAG TPA: diacylglycerol kinase family protein [Kofleriaceae bacterium]|nr:diacylglycerol kinase family protein [Kofleriaceae bacterium]